ncbi:MAG: PIN domain-containing protein [Deltaproteobacteria bacterium]|nr:PIN domain-containing protein [Deltaproteobacteria bacterium]
MCSLQRPLEARTQIRIAIEAEAILGILSLCESGQAELIASEVLVFEVERNPHPVRKRYAVEVLSRARQFVHTDRQVEERARALHASGIKPLDALHLASAVEAHADYFCTCDDRFLTRAKSAVTLHTRVVSPLELIAEVTR